MTVLASITPRWLISALVVLGTFTLSHGILQTIRTLWVYVRPSSLSKYRHDQHASWALVTGATDGIGRAFVKELLLRGFSVALHGRDPEKLARVAEEVVKELGVQAKGRDTRIIVADATDTHQDLDAVRRSMEEVPGKLTVLVNNVGGIHSQRTYQTLDASTSKDLIDCINVNAAFTTVLTSTLLPLLKKNGPSLILNSGSIASTICPPYIAAYVGTKAYLHSWASSLKLELKAQGYADRVEVLTCAIGNTASKGNTYEEAGSTLTSAACAKACLDRVGCGWDVVIPHPKYLLTVLPLYFLPTDVIKNAMIPILKKRFDAEEKTYASR